MTSHFPEKPEATDLKAAIVRFRRPRRLTVAVVVLCAGIIGALAAVSADVVFSTKAALLGERRNAVENLAYVIAEQTHQLFFTQDLAISSIDEFLVKSRPQNIEVFAETARRRETQEKLLDAILQTPEVESFNIFGADGVLLATTRGWPAQPIDASESDYFKALRNASGHALVVSSPRKSPFTGLDSIVVARRVNGPNGEFFGVAMAAIAVNRLSTVYASLADAGAWSVTLLHRDGLVMSHLPGNAPPGSVITAERDYYLRALALSARAGVDSRSLRPKDPPELIAFAAVRGYPLVVRIAMSEARALEGWRREMALAIALFLFSIALIILMAWAFLREYRFGERKFRSVVETVAVGIILFDRAGDITFANRAAAGIVGLSQSEILGRPISAYFPALAHIPELLHPTTAAGGEGGHLSSESLLETVAKTDAGKEFPAEAFLSEWMMGRERRYSLIFRDITQAKISEAALLHAQKIEALGQLTSGVAHDFNNVMTTIAVNANLIESSLARNEDAGEFVSDIFKTVDRGTSLTQRLLAFSRKQALSPVVVDIPELVHGLSGMLVRTLGDDINLDIQASADVWQAYIDANQFETALINLVINARDAMPGGGRLDIKITNGFLDNTYVANHPEVESGDYVLVEVCDNGEGISPENLQKVFDPFFTSKGPGKGSGLGLSMVYGFVKQSRGHISIYSERAVGTAVRIYLPRAQGSAPTPPRKETTVRHVQGHGRILLVEDDPSIRAGAVTGLRLHGYTVLEAGDGSEALALLQTKGPFDLLFSDISLPGGFNGWQVWQAARQIQPTISGLMTSGYPDEAITRNADLASEVILLRKPYKLDDLIAAIVKILGPGPAQPGKT